MTSELEWKIGWDVLAAEEPFVDLQITSGDLHFACALSPAMARWLANKLLDEAAKAQHAHAQLFPHVPPSARKSTTT